MIYAIIKFNSHAIPVKT